MTTQKVELGQTVKFTDNNDTQWVGTIVRLKGNFAIVKVPHRKPKKRFKKTEIDTLSLVTDPYWNIERIADAIDRISNNLNFS